MLWISTLLRQLVFAMCTLQRQLLLQRQLADSLMKIFMRTGIYSYWNGIIFAVTPAQELLNRLKSVIYTVFNIYISFHFLIRFLVCDRLVSTSEEVRWILSDRILSRATFFIYDTIQVSIFPHTLYSRVSFVYSFKFSKENIFFNK